MNLLHIQGQEGLEVKVVPNSNETMLVEKDGQIRIHLKATPEKNKANLELIKFFKKRFNLRVEIISGLKARKKVLRIKNQ